LTNRPRKKNHALLLVGLAAGMFGFAFALVPLYNILCEITGINGKTASEASVVEAVPAAESREVTLHLMAKVGRGLPWDVRPVAEQMTVAVGELKTTHYLARNRADSTVYGQAVPSVSPGRAAQYLKKVECFCFTQQELAAGEEIEMPVRFFVSSELPDDIKTLSLSYTLFPIDSDQAVAANRGTRSE